MRYTAGIVRFIQRQEYSMELIAEYEAEITLRAEKYTF